MLVKRSWCFKMANTLVDTLYDAPHQTECVRLIDAVEGDTIFCINENPKDGKFEIFDMLVEYVTECKTIANTGSKEVEYDKIVSLKSNGDCPPLVACIDGDYWVGFNDFIFFSKRQYALECLEKFSKSKRIDGMKREMCDVQIVHLPDLLKHIQDNAQKGGIDKECFEEYTLSRNFCKNQSMMATLCDESYEEHAEEIEKLITNKEYRLIPMMLHFWERGLLTSGNYLIRS